MPPWGPAGILSPEDVVHIVAFLQTLKGNPPFVPPPEKDPTRNPHTRPTIAPYYGDNLDPATNPAVVFAENALAAWSARGQAGKAGAHCHAGGPEKAMRGVATKYPKDFSADGGVMSGGGFLTLHAPEMNWEDMLAASADQPHNTTVLNK